jgi:hypothetical protein
MTTKNTLTHKTCSKCNISKTLKENYYLAANDTINSDSKLCICKACLTDLVNMDDVDTLVNVMRSIDRPFLKSTYDSSLTKKNSFGEYMRMLGTPQNREKNYLDSEFAKGLEKFSNKKELAAFNSGVELDAEGYTEKGLAGLKKKWGKHEVEDYVFLEEFYKEYSHSYNTDAPAQINLYKNIAKVHLQAEKELSKGNIKTYKDLMDLSSKLHTDGNIKPIQNTGANEDRGLSSYGLWVKEIEKEEPCEHFEDKPLYEDYDSFNKYWDKWFVRPLKNIFNVTHDFDVRDDD